MYKVAGSYTLTNSGGKKVNCPMCMGKGEIKKLESIDTGASGDLKESKSVKSKSSRKSGAKKDGARKEGPAD